ncbi:MAG: hypothetical protein SCAL_000370 [Candidatus Syntrophoarchaeum caldarius]|uniref:Glycosyltransferase n=1 Tax=Candidatus Syntropharchaeum caldarium TaxID=1838285 RepID=A0A1F2PCE3_9EURY|nr:MAG: hypothetical protein SCAL_000370 [Candidatus Syntrophoarchaeum caldarius]
MKLTMVIPSYWGRKEADGWREGDAIYDHPVPLDQEGTLGRAIASTAILNDKDFRLVIIAVATSPEIEAEVEKKVKGIVIEASAKTDLDVLVFGPSHLKQIHELLRANGKKEYTELLKLRGYSNIRNLCIFIPHILGSELALLIDDDEVFEDPDFIGKAQEFIGSEFEGEPVNAVAGYYLQEDGDYHVRREHRPWMDYWDKHARMNEAFDLFIGTGPRLKVTPFVFGGNMIIHRDLFTVVPFDPGVTRGEDIDYLMNAKIFGFDFFLDNELSIKHLPPPKPHPTWKQLREDIYRFVYEKAKIDGQKDIEGLTRITPEQFDPYPGCFLKEDLFEKIEKACKLLSEEYLSSGSRKDSEEALKNIELARTDAIPAYNPFDHLCEIQRLWQDMMEYTGNTEVRSEMQAIIEGKGCEKK